MFYAKHYEFLNLCKVNAQGDFLYIIQLDLERAKHPYLAYLADFSSLLRLK